MQRVHQVEVDNQTGDVMVRLSVQGSVASDKYAVAPAVAAQQNGQATLQTAGERRIDTNGG